jgi:hypothetical protein
MDALLNIGLPYLAGIYLVIIMCMISFSLFLAIIIVNLHHRRPKLGPAPQWIKTAFLEKVPRLLGIQLPKVVFNYSTRLPGFSADLLGLLNYIAMGPVQHNTIVTRVHNLCMCDFNKTLK